MAKNLIVVAHPDDEVLGFAGTGSSLVDRGDIVQAIILCGGVSARTKRPNDDELLIDIEESNNLLGFNFPILGTFPNLALNTIPHIELVKFIESFIVDFKPDRIFTHHPSDLNDDHKQVSLACMAASRYFQRNESSHTLGGLYFMEILSSTDWAYASNTNIFSPQVFFDISKTIDKKIESLNCYRNVVRPSPHPRSERVMRGHAAYRGGQCGVDFAEAFQIAFQMGLD